MNIILFQEFSLVDITDLDSMTSSENLSLLLHLNCIGESLTISVHLERQMCQN